MALNLHPNTNLVIRHSRSKAVVHGPDDQVSYDGSAGIVGPTQTDNTPGSDNGGSSTGSKTSLFVRRDEPITVSMLDDAQLQRNMQAVEAHLNWDHYHAALPPDRWTTSLTAETATTKPIAYRIDAWAFPDDSTTRIYSNIRPLSQWTTGKFKITLYYTADGGSTNNFRVFFNVYSALAGVVLDATMTTVTNLVTSLPGPGTAFVPIEYVAYSSASMPAGTRIIGVSMGRIGADAADTNTNNLLMVDCDVEFVSAYLEAHR